MKTRRTDIEGMRALAVGLVVLNHAGVPWLSGGYIGVDVFFVISGFLITQLLIDEAGERSTIDLRNFWARRARRILPMSILVALATVIAGLFMLEPGKVRDLSAIGLGALGFCTNIVLFFRTSDYLSGVTTPSPLRHFWSLAVEEQFYLLWPLVVFATVKYGKAHWRKWLLGVGTVGGIASLITSVLITKGHPGAGYYLPYSRFWEISAGALLAIAGSRIDKIPQIVKAIGGWVGLIAVLASAVILSESTIFPGYTALLPVVATVFVLVAGNAKFGPVSLLSLEPLQSLGARSFSLYLWHWPLFVLVEARFGTPSVWGRAWIVIAALVLSAISYRIVEQPIRHNTWLSTTSLRSLSAAGIALSLSFSAVVVLFAVAPKIDAGAMQLAEMDAAQDAAISGDSATGAADVLPAVKPVHVLLLGDSTMAGLRWFEDGEKSLQGFTYTLDAESCRRISEWSCFGREKRTPKNVVTVLKETTETFDAVVLMAGYDSSVKKIGEEFKDLIDVVRDKNLKLIVMTYKESLYFPASGSRGKRSVYAEFNAVVRDTVARDAQHFALADWNAYSAGQKSWFRPDGIHLNIDGTLALGAFISTAVAENSDNPCPFTSAYPCSYANNLPQTTDFLAKFNVADTEKHCYEDGEARKKVCTTDRRI
ncbi:MAG: acyltransferase family protein [Actinomycetota bacterium]